MKCNLDKRSGLDSRPPLVDNCVLPALLQCVRDTKHLGSLCTAVVLKLQNSISLVTGGASGNTFLNTSLTCHDHSVRIVSPIISLFQLFMVPTDS